MNIVSGVMLQTITEEIMVKLNQHDLSLNQKLLVLEKAQELCKEATS